MIDLYITSFIVFYSLIICLQHVQDQFQDDLQKAILASKVEFERQQQVSPEIMKHIHNIANDPKVCAFSHLVRSPKSNEQFGGFRPVCFFFFFFKGKGSKVFST